MYLLKNPFSHVSHDTVQEFENSLESYQYVHVLRGYSKISYNIWYFFFRAFLKIHINIIPRPIRKHRCHVCQDQGHIFTIMIGAEGSKLKPYVLGNFHNKSIYMFDAWPKRYEDIEELCDFYKIDYLFVSSVQSAERLQQRLSKTIVRYVPEAVDFNEYTYYNYSEKDVDVLSVGRRWEDYHRTIVNDLETAGIKYLYARGDSLLFPDRSTFLDGMARTKISLCVPASITEPQRAGDVETMTVRYLQAMASKCLVLGIAPAEMVKLFGYNPIVTIDMSNPVGQIRDILNNYSQYIPLIEKNYELIVNNHSWHNRIELMNEIWDCAKRP